MDTYSISKQVVNETRGINPCNWQVRKTSDLLHGSLDQIIQSIKKDNGELHKRSKSSSLLFLGASIVRTQIRVA